MKQTIVILILIIGIFIASTYNQPERVSLHHPHIYNPCEELWGAEPSTGWDDTVNYLILWEQCNPT